MTEEMRSVTEGFRSMTEGARRVTEGARSVTGLRARLERKALGVDIRLRGGRVACAGHVVGLK